MNASRILVLTATTALAAGAAHAQSAHQQLVSLAQGVHGAGARDVALAAIAQTRQYIDAHVASWPENYAIGRAAYDRMLKQEQLLPYDSGDVGRIAQDELAHGWAEEAWLRQLSQHRGVELGAPSGGGLAPGGAALIDYYRDCVAQLRKFVTDFGLVMIPAWLGTRQVVETPVAGGCGHPARHERGLRSRPRSLDRGARGTAGPLHAAVDRAAPSGLRAPDRVERHVRRRLGLLGEEMFVRLGLYGDDLDGRLAVARWEWVRGARAVVDPELASGEWTCERAAEYLRRKAADASLHDFHDRLLSYGTTPFAILWPELLADLEKPASEVRAAANY